VCQNCLNQLDVNKQFVKIRAHCSIVTVLGPISSTTQWVPSCTGFFGPYTVCFGVGYICTLTPSSTLGHVLSIYVASEMTNSNLFQKIQNFPKNPNFSKKSKIGQKAKIGQKSQNWQKKAKIGPKYQNWPKIPKLAQILANLAFWALFEIFGLFGFFFGPFFCFFGNFWISCSLHRGYI
jgi:hypothetical protein